MNRQKHLINFLIAISGFAIWYLGTAFVLLEPNISNWKQSTRLLLVLEAPVFSVFIFAMYKALKSN